MRKHLKYSEKRPKATKEDFHSIKNCFVLIISQTALLWNSIPRTFFFYL